MDWNENGERERRQERMQEHAERLQGVIASLADSKDGQFFLRWLIARCGTFAPNVINDQQLAAYNEGRRSIGLDLLKHCAAVNCIDMLLAKEPEK